MINNILHVKDIRKMFKTAYENQEFTVDRTGVKTIEIIGSTFIADEDHIIRKPNFEYIERELEWYKSMSLNVNDIPGNVPEIWKMVSDKEGNINSNYGWCIWSKSNFNQYENVLNELKKNKDTRRAVMIYNRPSMHYEYNADGMNDFMCTFANSFFIRNNNLISHYLMRSNDVVFGYGNDYAWAKYVQEKLCNDLKEMYHDLEVGDIIWTASNIHVYERHFNLVKALNV